MRNRHIVALLCMTVLALCPEISRGENAILGTTGTTSNYFNTSNRMRAIVRSASENGTLDSFYVYVANVQPGAVAKGVLYDSTTLQLIDSTAEREMSVDGGSFHWESFAFVNSGPIESGRTYLLGIFIGPTYTGVGREPTTDSRYYIDLTYSNGVPQSLSGGVWATDQTHSIYVVYTIGTGESTDRIRRRRIIN